MIGIYKITSPTNKVYIGQSWDIKKRWRYYWSKYTKNQAKLENSFNKHGIENHVFTIEFIFDTEPTQKELDSKEQFHIDFYRNSGYELLNLKEAGSNGKLSEEARKRMSLSRMGNKNTLGRKLTDEHKAKISKAGKNRVCKDETKAKLRESRSKQVMRKGWHQSEETKERIRQNKLAYWANKKANQKNEY